MLELKRKVNFLALFIGCLYVVYDSKQDKEDINMLKNVLIASLNTLKEKIR